MVTKKNSTGLDSVGAPAETNYIYIYHPTTGEVLYDDENNAMWIEVYGMDSKHYKNVQQQQTDRRIQQAQRTGSRATVTAQQQEAMNLELMAKCTSRWNIQLDDGKPECAEKNAKGVYERFPWLRDQVWDFIHSRQAFLKS
jgi:hypothetical protein